MSKCLKQQFCQWKVLNSNLKFIFNILKFYKLYSRHFLEHLCSKKSFYCNFKKERLFIKSVLQKQKQTKNTDNDTLDISTEIFKLKSIILSHIFWSIIFPNKIGNVVFFYFLLNKKNFKRIIKLFKSMDRIVIKSEKLLRKGPNC